MIRAPRTGSRFSDTPRHKAAGVTYTPKALADFVARQMLDAAPQLGTTEPIRLLDPAAGHGELLASALTELAKRQQTAIEVWAFDTDAAALGVACGRLSLEFPHAQLRMNPVDFLEFVLGSYGEHGQTRLFADGSTPKFDLVISNPPYVRTQVMGAERARLLAAQFSLTDRVDLYHAFLLAIAEVIKTDGVAGVIVSNRFMTTRSGAATRRALRERFRLRHVWDLGDTKLFDVAVLPAVIVAAGGQEDRGDAPRLTSIYETDATEQSRAADVISALAGNGVVRVADGRKFLVRRGHLNASDAASSIWRVATPADDGWLATVAANTWGTFRDLGKIRVGVKTCADSIFIRSDWDEMTGLRRPELLQLLTTHHVARRFRADFGEKTREILYPHEVVAGQRRPVDLQRYPRSREYLETHRPTLESRSYLIEAGREWFEIWVPQNPALWKLRKLVFRDISNHPEFWLDDAGTVVNGDCYWLVCTHPLGEQLLWLALAVANSRFIEAFYDRSFQNKLYAGRRRYMTQYVEKFPLPDPASDVAVEMVGLSREIHGLVGSGESAKLQRCLDDLVWTAFGLTSEEVTG